MVCARGSREDEEKEDEEEVLDTRCNENKKSIYIPEEYVYGFLVS